MDISRMEKLSATSWQIPATAPMRVPAVIYGSEKSVLGMDEKVAEQLRNVASLPGIVRAAYAMPDAHWGYGFPVGGVAAFDTNEGGVVSAGGVGFDVSCGVRAHLTELTRNQIVSVQAQLADELFREIPAGLGSHSAIALEEAEMTAMLEGGAGWAIQRGYGRAEDLERIEEHGCAAGADPAAVSDHARKRQRREMGTARLRQSLSRSAGNCGDLRRRSGERLRVEKGRMRGFHPLRFAGARPPNRHRVHARNGDWCGGSRLAGLFPTASLPTRR